MLGSQLSLLTQVRSISRVCVLVGLALSVVLGTGFSNAIHAQVVLALIALTIGIPHGAVDHLVAVPKFFSANMAAFLFGYLCVVGFAIGLLVHFPLLGFQTIVVLSALHFGVGDASFYMETFRRLKNLRFPRITYAFAAGSTPVVIPLVKSETRQTLKTVNPDLINWAGSRIVWILFACVAFNLITCAFLLFRKCYDPALDLLILLIVAYFAPPLVAFALYFGLWHAVRHTARLTLEYGPAVQQHAENKPWSSFWVTVRAGLPAVVIVLGLCIYLAVKHVNFTDTGVLWYLLVATWALTIPHMALTARFDVGALKV